MNARTKFTYDKDQASVSTSLICIQPGDDGYDGKTQQNFKDECDINTIVNNFLKTGEMPDNIKLPQYVDYEGIFDFRSAMETMMQAEESFMEIPAPVRAQFNNSPQEFLEFCSNPNNRDKLMELKLLKEPPPPEPVPEPTRVRIVPEPAPAGTSTPT